MGVMTDEEIRHLFIELLTAPTARDEQTTIGASNLANQCDYCLASNLLGDMRDTAAADRPWGGRVWGTAGHGLVESRWEQAFDDLKAGRRTALAAIAARYPDAEIEVRTILGSIPGYGPVGTTPDVTIPSRQTLIDLKGTERKKMLILLDALQIMQGKEPIYGRRHKEIVEDIEFLEIDEKATAKTGEKIWRKVKRDVNTKLSEAQYDDAIAKAIYKLRGYGIQTNLYGWAKNAQGAKITKLAIMFISRDGNMFFDNPALERYDDPSAVHDTNVISFPYNEAVAVSAWNRGIDLWLRLQAGQPIEDFERHEHCFACEMELRGQETAEELPDHPIEIAPVLLAKN